MQAKGYHNRVRRSDYCRTRQVITTSPAMQINDYRTNALPNYRTTELTHYSWSTNSRLRILPVAVIGRAERNSI